jgi:hypothetical protein
MNRVILIMDEHSHVADICSDEKIELYFISPSCPNDRVYLYRSVQVGTKFVDEQIRDWPIWSSTEVDHVFQRDVRRYGEKEAWRRWDRRWFRGPLADAFKHGKDYEASNAKCRQASD